MADPWDPSPSTVIFVHCGSRNIPGPCEPPRSQGPGSLQGQRGHRERIWRSECCPSPISCFKDRRHSALTALPALKSQTLQEWGEWWGAARGLWGGGGLQKNSCQQCGSQSGSGWKAWAGGLPSPQHLVSAASAVAPVTHTTLLDSGLSPAKAMGWISPCLHQSQWPANSIPPPIPGMTLPAQGPE